MLEETGSDADAAPRPSVNEAASRLVARMLAKAAALRIAPSRGPAGELLIDCGTAVTGGIAAGLWLAAICMGGLGRITVAPDATYPQLALRDHGRAPRSRSSPALPANMPAGSSSSDGFMAMGSGPARALARVEEIYRDIGYADEAETATLVLEADGPPPPAVIAQVAESCRIDPSALTVLFAPTRSLAGSVQIVARSLEVALHKAHAVAFPLDRIIDGIASAPFAPPHPDFLQALGRTNDAIIYGGAGAGCSSPARPRMRGRSPTSCRARNSRDHGAAVRRDLPAGSTAISTPSIRCCSSRRRWSSPRIDSGETFRAGRIDRELLDASFG